ncbi:MAG: EbsA family protein [Acidimicrobiia bacterium]|nr:EbsA family protein [Acidimicrobiia bacterium]MDH5503954.1 EbsA family protein [Acidimicrobiia bacterium]
MRQRTVQFRRWDHAAAALFFAALFTVSLLSEISAGAWQSTGPPAVALVLSIVIFLRRPGVVLRKDRLVVYTDWYMKREYPYDTIERIEVNEGEWVNPIMLKFVDDDERRMPMLGLGRRPNRYERKMIDALKEIIPVRWNKPGGS